MTGRHDHEPLGTASRRERRKPEFIVLRLLPGNSPLHRLWAGTKLIVVAALAVAVSIRPTWTTLGIVASIVAAGLVVARVPGGAFPRPPNWVWSLFLVAGVFTLRSGTPPVVHPAGLELSLGGLEAWALFTLLGLVLLISALLVGWTTPLGDVAPALSRLGAPLRWLRFPVDEWVVAVGLAIRCLPLLVDEIRTLVAVQRLRRHQTPADPFLSRRAVAQVARQAQDLLTTAVIVGLRRARDLADAITARGGFTSASATTSGPGRGDLAVLAALIAIMVFALTR